ncbi:alpha/beta fold hydrolase [Porphyrobacter algicida]|uniref:Alpha/beta fold hydrolase n=1 Tax=Qipengyuania algicida TaxID=1836209 RepID=A0A845AGB9_9SPHN|nr:alpha/beta hydrolase [Qipengyuania algicida]MXP29632.1 alpha/beta fold hydrolase [Qipengyuania algicida]
MNDLVLIPGLGSDETVWRKTIELLSDDYRCAVGDTLQDSTLPDMAQRILADAPDKFVLAGLSMGGMVALEIMRLAPERVAGLALIDSNAFPDTSEQAQQRVRTIETLRAGVDMRSAGQASLAWLVHPDASLSVKEDIVQMSIRLGVEVYIRQSEAVLNRRDQRPVLREIDIPTAIIHGVNDAMIPLTRAEETLAMISDASLEIIHHCGHLPPIEKPAEAATILGRLCDAVGCKADGL